MLNEEEVVIQEEEVVVEEEVSSEQVDADFRGLDDSLNLIARLKSGDVGDMPEEEVADCIDRNERHIEIVLNRPYIRKDARYKDYS